MTVNVRTLVTVWNMTISGTNMGRKLFHLLNHGCLKVCLFAVCFLYHKRATALSVFSPFVHCTIMRDHTGPISASIPNSMFTQFKPSTFPYSTVSWHIGNYMFWFHSSVLSWSNRWQTNIYANEALSLDNSWLPLRTAVLKYVEWMSRKVLPFRVLLPIPQTLNSLKM